MIYEICSRYNSFLWSKRNNIIFYFFYKYIMKIVLYLLKMRIEHVVANMSFNRLCKEFAIFLIAVGINRISASNYAFRYNWYGNTVVTNTTIILYNENLQITFYFNDDHTIELKLMSLKNPYEKNLGYDIPDSIINQIRKYIINSIMVIFERNLKCV